jgi:hypothetical protein
LTHSHLIINYCNRVGMAQLVNHGKPTPTFSRWHSTLQFVWRVSTPNNPQLWMNTHTWNHQRVFGFPICYILLFPLKFATAAVSHAIPKVRPQGDRTSKAQSKWQFQWEIVMKSWLTTGLLDFRLLKTFRQTKIGIRTFGIIIVYHSAFYPTYKPLLSFTDPEHLSTAIDSPCWPHLNWLRVQILYENPTRHYTKPPPKQPKHFIPPHPDSVPFWSP